MSRVHVLLIEITGVLYAIDTASSNGVRNGADEIRVARVENGTTLALVAGWRS